MLLASDLNNALTGINTSHATYRELVDFPQTVILSGGSTQTTSPASGCVNLTALVAVQNGQLLNVPTTISINILGSSCAYGTGEAAGSSPRIDTVCIQFTTTPTNPQTRTFETTTNGQTVTTTDLVNVTQVDSFAIQVVHGTPSSSPTAPAVPTGWIGLAQVAVPANATTISGGITDISSTYRTDGGRLGLVSGNLLSWIDASTLGVDAGVAFQWGGTTLTQTTAGQFQLQGASSFWVNAPTQFAYSGKSVVIQPTVDAASGTHVLSIKTAGGTEVGSWDNEGNLIGNGGTFASLSAPVGPIVNSTAAQNTTFGLWNYDGTLTSATDVSLGGLEFQYNSTALSALTWNATTNSAGGLVDAWVEWYSYNLSAALLQIDFLTGSITTLKNTLDNGSGAATIAGTLSSNGITNATGTTFTNNGTYAGTPLITGITVNNGLSVTNPTSPGSATLDLVLSGTTLTTNSDGLAINLANENIWTATQTFQLSGSTQSVVIQPNSNYSFVGVYNGGTYYGIGPGLPSPNGYATLGGYYSGLGIGGNTSSSTTSPIFGVLANNQSGNGIGNTAFTVYANNVVETYHNILDDGSGNTTVSGTLTVNGGYAGVPVLTSLTAATAMSVTNPTAPGAATVGLVLSGTTLGTNADGLFLNLANANTWTAPQTYPGGLVIESFDGGSWINLPTSGPSGLGTGGAGTNAWIGYAAESTQWFSDSLAGDVAYRNNNGRLLFGTTSASQIQVSSTGVNLSTPVTVMNLAVTDLSEANGGLLVQNNYLGTNWNNGSTSFDFNNQDAGIYLAWNMTGGNGEGDIVTLGSTGVGGVVFWNGVGTTTPITLTKILELTEQGALVLNALSSPPTTAGAVAYNGTTLTVGNGTVSQAPTASEQYIPVLWDSGYQSCLSTDNSAGSYVLPGFSYTVPSSFSANMLWAFEINLYVGASGYTAYAALWDVVAGAEVPNSVVSTTSTSAVIVRSASFNLTPGQQYFVTAWVSGYENTITHFTDASLVINPA